MKQVAIIGIGMNAATATAEALDAVKKADMLLGAKRMVDEFSAFGKPSRAVYRPDEVAAEIEASGAERFAVLVSGDVGFFSGAAGLHERLKTYDITLVPGVSSASYFFARCCLPWQEAELLSCHGTDTDIVGAVRRNRLTFALTGGNVRQLAEALRMAGFGLLPVWAGENLGAGDERIFTGTVTSLTEKTWAPLTVLIIENKGYDPRIRTGIPDVEFIRSDIPMTKAEVRAACLSRVSLRPTDICYDIGCGTGSVTVELALSAYRGRVYAIDKNEAALALTEENCAGFHVGNVITVGGIAPAALSELPPPDAAIIGGSSGNMNGIVTALLKKNPKVRIVITAVALESAAAAVRALKTAGICPEVVQLSTARGRAAGELHLMCAQNPVFIISGGGTNE